MFYGYLDINQADHELFWTYKKEFYNWSPEWFRRLDAKLRTAFKQILRSRGVYTGPNHGQIYRQLADLKNLNSPPEWPEEERRKQEFVATSRFSKAGQEREAQKQIRRNQANVRLAALRAIANDRA
jgi:G3E family GTPase